MTTTTTGIGHDGSSDGDGDGAGSWAENKLTVLLNLGMLHSWMGHLREAVTTFTQLLACLEERGSGVVDGRRMAEAFNHRADAYSNQV
jgi:hypothetical protein